jgi:hypothetical protein
MSIIRDIVLDIFSRLILVFLGILVSIVGFFSPSACIGALAKVTIVAKQRGKL